GVDGECRVERDVAGAVGRDIHRADERLALAEPGDVAGRAGEELEPERPAGEAVQRPHDRRRARPRRDGGDDRIVLLVVRTRVGVAGFVRSAGLTGGAPRRAVGTSMRWNADAQSTM